MLRSCVHRLHPEARSTARRCSLKIGRTAPGRSESGRRIDATIEAEDVVMSLENKILAELYNDLTKRGSQMCFKLRALPVLLLAGRSACMLYRSGVHPLPESPCSATPAAAEGWRVLDREYYSLRLPTDAQRVEITGQYHGNIERYRARGFTVQFSFDPWSGPTGIGEDGPSSSDCTTVIGGREVRIVTAWRQGEHLIHAAWGEIAPGALGSLGLSVSFRARDIRRYDEMIAILRSVQFN